MRFNESEEIMDYITLFVSVLICFPEVGTIKLNREEQEISLTFILQENKADKEKGRAEVDEALVSIEKSLASFHRMQSKKESSYRYDVKRYTYDDYMVLEVVRDVETVTRLEINFLIELFRQHFIERLLRESIDPNIVDEFGWYDEGRQDVFSDKNKVAFADDQVGKQVLACREAGRVLVFSS